MIERVTEISEETFKRAGGRGTKLGTGGMITKLKAAEIMLKAKKAMLLANGENPSIIFKLLDGTALGTLFKGTE